MILCILAPGATALQMKQLRLELVNLSTKILHDLLVSSDVEVDADDIADDGGFDVLGAVCIVEGVVSVLVRHARGAHIRNHHRATVTSQRVLQNARQLAVTIRNVGRRLVVSCTKPVYT